MLEESRHGLYPDYKHPQCLSRTRGDDNCFHGRLAFFAVEVAGVGDSRGWQMTWNSSVSQYLELCIGCRCQNLTDLLWDKQMSIRRARHGLGGTARLHAMRPGGGRYGG
jgi:hypothetical protein